MNNNKKVLLSLNDDNIKKLNGLAHIYESHNKSAILRSLIEKDYEDKRATIENYKKLNIKNT